MVHDEEHPSRDDAPGQAGERVAKALARAGVASRREIERLIEAGRVALNGQVLTTPAVKVEPGDILTVDGKVVGETEPTRLFRYHKPTGLMTTHTDPKGRPTVFAALPPGLPRLISVGRLDLNSEGLLLLTNDGGLSRALELPSNAWVRRYRARAYGDPSQEKLDRLKDGITVEGVRYGPIEAKLDKASGRNVWITVTLAEGKNREVRRVLEAIGLKVNRLIRLSYGPFALGTLAQGEVEEVGPRVIRELLAGVIAPQNMPKGDKPLFKGVSKASPSGGDEAGDGGSHPHRRERKPPRSKASDGEPPVKKTYKAGWAKPKAKKPYRGPPKAKAGPAVEAPPKRPRAPGPRRRG